MSKNNLPWLGGQEQRLDEAQEYFNFYHRSIPEGKSKSFGAHKKPLNCNFRAKKGDFLKRQ